MKFWELGFCNVVGVDEVGCGLLVGFVVVVVCIIFVLVIILGKICFCVL